MVDYKRLKKTYTAAELCEAAGITRARLSHYRTGRKGVAPILEDKLHYRTISPFEYEYYPLALDRIQSYRKEAKADRQQRMKIIGSRKREHNP